MQGVLTKGGVAVETSFYLYGESGRYLGTVVLSVETTSATDFWKALLEKDRALYEETATFAPVSGFTAHAV